MGTGINSCPKCGAPLPASAPEGLCPRCVMAMNMATQTDFTGEEGPHGTKILKPAPLPEDLAEKFPELEILELLGRGGMGAVYKARQKELDRIVALKILPPGIEETPGFAERFTREAKALAKLNHPNVVTLYEFGRTDGLFFFLMEYVDGVNLRQLLASGRVAPREALAIVPQICDALQYAHDQGIVHRDIKPDNILMDRRGRVKVADFGLAKIVGEVSGRATEQGAEAGASGANPAAQELTEAGKVMGTPQYMAPEQEETPLAVDHRADIYALGVVFYQMLTGELPGEPIEPPSSKVQIDVRLDEVVLRALEKNPERRYGQASVLKTQVETIAASPPVGASPFQQQGDQQPDDKHGEAFDQHRHSLKAPAIGLLVAGGVNLLPLVVAMVLLGWGMISESGPRIAGFFNVSGLLVSAIGGLLIFGAMQMMRLHNYGLCVAAGILAMITPPGLLLGLPFGIWALVVLSRTQVRKAFESNRSSSTTKETETGEPRRRSGRLIVKLAAAVIVLCAGWLTQAYIQSRGVAVRDINRVPQIEQKLAREVETHLQAADYDASSVFVRLAPPRYSRGECSIAGLRQFDGPRPTEPGVQRAYFQIHGGGLVRHEGNGLWSFFGDGALQRISFHIDALQQTGAGTKGYPPKEASSSLAPKTEFAAILTDGSFVELVSLIYGPGGNPRRTQGAISNLIDFWKPDGTRNEEYGRWSFGPGTLSSARDPALEYRGIVARWEGPDTNTLRLMGWQLGENPQDSADGQFPVTPKGESAENWIGLTQGFPRDEETATIRFALASGPYVTGPRPGFLWSSSDKTPYGSFTIGKIFDHNGNAAVTLTHNLKGCDYRLRVMIDRFPRPKSQLGGFFWRWKRRPEERYQPVYGRPVKGGPFNQTFEFPGVPAKEAMAGLPRIDFEVRPVQWVEFQNVALNPGEETRVHIQVNDAGIEAPKETGTRTHVGSRKVVQPPGGAAHGDNAIGLALIPPETAKLLERTRALSESYHRSADRNTEIEFHKNLAALTAEMKWSLRGTIAEPLLREQEEETLKYQNALRAKDEAAAKEAMARTQELCKQIVSLISPDLVTSTNRSNKISESPPENL